jgi:hypothetical protein
MKIAPRQAWLGIALIGTLAAVWFAPEPQEETAAAVAPARKSRTTQPDNVREAKANGGQLQRALRTDVPSVFDVTSWVEPRAKAPPPQIAPVLPEAEVLPQAPVAPLRILGRFVEDGVVGMFVQYNDRTLVARAGDVIADVYKVASIADQGMTVVYLPMNLTQTITMGAAN